MSANILVMFSNIPRISLKSFVPCLSSRSPRYRIKGRSKIWGEGLAHLEELLSASTRQKKKMTFRMKYICRHS